MNDLDVYIKDYWDNLSETFTLTRTEINFKEPRYEDLTNFEILSILPCQILCFNEFKITFVSFFISGTFTIW